MTKRILITFTLLIQLFFNLPGQTNVNGLIDLNTTWTLTNSPYIINGNTIVNEDVTLIIEAGVIIKLETDVTLRVDGEIIAIGTESNKIVFTSNATTPSNGDWGQILYTDNSKDAVFNNNAYVSGNILKYCVIEYGGSTGRGLISIDLSSPYFTNSIIRYSSSDGINADQGSLRINASQVSNNNNKGLYLYRSLHNNILIENSKIHENSGGGIHFENIYQRNPEIKISGNEIYQNNGTGAIHYNGGQSTIIEISNNDIHDNIASNGGALFAEGGTINFTNNKVIRNSASTGAAFSIQGDYATNNYAFNDNFIDSNTGNNTIINLNILVNYETDFSFKNNQVSNNIANSSLIKCIGDAYPSPDWPTDVLFYFDNNDFKQNESENLFEVEGFEGRINENNFIDNITTHIIKNSNTSILKSVDAKENFWGTIDENIIGTSVYDFFDNGNISLVNYIPFKTEAINFGNETSISKSIREVADIKIFPNPADEFIVINVDKLQIQKIQLSNILGQVYMTPFLGEESDKVRLNISHLKKGQYIISIFGKDLKKNAIFLKR